MRVALYARYSTDNQRVASIADQFRLCRLQAEKQGWTIAEEYSDQAISGSTLILRPGIQALINDGLQRRFQLVLAEALDRLSRDQEDIAGLYKRLRFAGVQMVTLAEGEISELHVGLKGTMNALFLKDLADKTRRGLRGRVEGGKSGGGNSYGYSVVKQFAPTGKPVRGDRTIDEAEAAIVRRIFRNYAAGKSAKRIASELNRDRVPAPSGGHWGFSTINGNAKRGNGILNNEVYIGKIVWNRQRFLKDPDTGKRVARLNPSEEWVVKEVPELRILDDELWQAVKARQSAVKITRTEDGRTVENHFRDRRRPKYLFSGLTTCGCCGAGYTLISAVLVGCAAARNKGTCSNRLNIRRDRIEARILNALSSRLMDPELFAAFCEEFTKEMNRVRLEASGTLEAARRELDRTGRQIKKLIEAIKDGVPPLSVKDEMIQLEARKAELSKALEAATEPPLLLHPNMATYYRQQVGKLHEALQEETEDKRLHAADVLRSLVQRIVLTPEDGELRIELVGDLAGILSIAVKPKPQTSPSADTTSLTQNSRPIRAAALSNLASQVEMVAGAGFEPTTFRL
jgi:site-specific DNA recombinase